MIELLEKKEEKYQLIYNILTQLQEWFGIPESLEQYAEEGKNLVVYQYITEKKERIGFICIKETSEAAAELYVMGIKKEFHRHGIGRKMVQQCEQHCRREGKQLLQVKTLSPEVKNPYYLKTWNFYKAMGFLPLEVLPLWDEWNPCMVMVKCLD